MHVAARKKINTYREQYAYNRNITFMPAVTSTSSRNCTASFCVSSFYRPAARPRRSATTLRIISLFGILQWPEEQSRSGCGLDGGDADQSQHRRVWRCRSSCPLLLARPSPPRQPPCSQRPRPPRRSIVRGGLTRTHQPRLVVSFSTCPPLSLSPSPAHSFFIGPAVKKHANIHSSEPQAELDFLTEASS